MRMPTLDTGAPSGATAPAGGVRPLPMTMTAPRTGGYTGLGAVRSSALASQGNNPGSSSPALRQGNQLGPAETNLQDMGSAEAEYATWFKRQMSLGKTPEQIAQSPEFQSWQNRMISLAGRANDPTLINDRINMLDTSSREGGAPWKGSQIAMRDAWQGRKDLLARPPTAAPGASLRDRLNAYMSKTPKPLEQVKSGEQLAADVEGQVANIKGMWGNR